MIYYYSINGFHWMFNLVEVRSKCFRYRIHVNIKTSKVETKKQKKRKWWSDYFFIDNSIKCKSDVSLTASNQLRCKPKRSDGTIQNYLLTYERTQLHLIGIAIKECPHFWIIISIILTRLFFHCCKNAAIRISVLQTC